MIVIPAINETDFEEVKKKIKSAQDFGAESVHLDVSDGKFTKNKLWNNPADLSNLKLKTNTLNLNLEVHLMVQNTDVVLDEWLDAKVKRLIVHLESVRDLDVMKMKCVAFGTELFLAIRPDTPVEHFFSHEGDANGFLILAVKPGLAGQKFSTGGGSTEGGLEYQLKRIRTLRQKFPNAKIEVDGGVNLDNTLAIKNAGADILVSASSIWGSKNPKEAYRKLIEL